MENTCGRNGQLNLTLNDPNKEKKIGGITQGSLIFTSPLQVCSVLF